MDLWLANSVTTLCLSLFPLWSVLFSPMFIWLFWAYHALLVYSFYGVYLSTHLRIFLIYIIMMNAVHVTGSQSLEKTGI